MQNASSCIEALKIRERNRRASYNLLSFSKIHKTLYAFFALLKFLEKTREHSSTDLNEKSISTNCRG
jgi:hypothetical protein